MLERMRILLSRFTALFRSEKLDRELEDELDFHLDMQTQENLRAGMSPEEAHRRAMLSFGGMERVKEECREKRGIAFIHDTVQDIRYGIRSLARNPLFAVAAIGTLALGIGANTAIFSIVDAALLHPLPFDHPEELIEVTADWRITRGDTVTQSIQHFDSPTLQLFRQEATTVMIAAYKIYQANLSETESADRIMLGEASSNLFPLLRIQPSIGRFFSEEDEKPGAAPVAVISYGVWNKRFSRNSDVLEKSLTLDSAIYSIVGVLPPSFDIPGASDISPEASAIDIWIPSRFDKDRYNRTASPTTIGRLKPGISIQTAEAELDTIYQSKNKALFERAGVTACLKATPWEDIVTERTKETLPLFFGAVGFVLLIACANTTNLLLARTIAREKEMHVRAALGASGSRMFRQLLTESLLLALLGGGLGLLLAFCSKGFLGTLLAENLIRLPVIPMNPRVLGFTLLVSITVALIVGIIPAWQLSRASGGASLNEGGRATIRKGLRRIFRGVVAIEIALVLTLLIGSGLFLRSLALLNRIDTGFQAENMLTMAVEPSPLKYPDASSQAAYFEKVLDRLHTLPGKKTIGAASTLPFGGFIFVIDGIRLEGQTQLTPAENLIVVSQVSDGYFRTMQIPLLQGREFSVADRENSANVAIIDSLFAHHYFPNQNPVGRKLMNLFNHNWTIVGVVEGVRSRLQTNEQRPYLYLPYLQQARAVSRMNVVVRGNGNPIQLVEPIRQALKSIDPDQPAFNIMTMEGLLAKSLQRERTHFAVIGAFAVLSLLLVFIGIYGVVSFSVNSRTHEIGIRIALGARKIDIVTMVLRETLFTCVCGLLIGVLLAIGTTRIIAGLLYGVTATDPMTFAAAILFVTVVVGIAGLIPACRAAAANPITCLRHE